MGATTLVEKIWDGHVVDRGDADLLYISLRLVHEVISPQAFEGLRVSGRKLRNCREFGVELHPMGSAGQAIVHVMGPEMGLTQPGMTIVCGDSHTATHGAFGAIAFGIGTSQVEHVMATQTLVDGQTPDDGGHDAGPALSRDVVRRVVSRERAGVHETRFFLDGELRAGQSGGLMLLSLSVNQSLGMLAGDHLALLATVRGLEEGWEGPSPRNVTRISELRPRPWEV